MAIRNEITVKVNMELSVSESTADTALNLLNLYLNQNKDKCLDLKQNEDGEKEYFIKDFSERSC